MATIVQETLRAAKARGAFYTPIEITRFLSRWAVRSAGDTVLEPSAGDGAFLTALAERFRELGMEDASGHVVAIEREPYEAQRAALLSTGSEVRAIDFFDLDPAMVGAVSAVVGNPPYIRYQGFRGVDRDKAAARSLAQGIRLTGLASSWAHFVVHATAFLDDHGRLALVLPAELLHTDYSAPIRALLLRRFSSVTIVAFDRTVFPTAQVDAVLLLASDDDPAGFRVVRTLDETTLGALSLATPATAPSSQRWSGSIHEDASAVYEAAVSGDRAMRLGSLAHVDIGFVSGANDFFVLAPDRATDLGLPSAVLTPAVRRPSDVPGLFVRQGEEQFLVELHIGDSLDASTQRYVAEGQARGIHLRYKCRVRSPWYAVPLPKRKPDAFLPYMHHLGPRLIVNTLGARNTNLLHGVALKAGAPSAAALAVAMTSSLTHLSAEIEGRAYGGGVLKLETKEAERLRVPHISNPDLLAAALPEVDGLVRVGDIERAASLTDEILSLPHADLWAAYLTLRVRRLGRKRRRGERA